MHPNEQLIRDFYAAFARKDGAAMGACYAPAVRFSDPVFGALAGDQARAMWAMLTGRSKDLDVRLTRAAAGDRDGTAAWEAFYTFSTGRKVHNVIEARFVFTGGRIVEHHDRFDLYKWTRMALGLPGIVLGWSPIIQGRVRAEAAVGLTKFMASGRA